MTLNNHPKTKNEGARGVALIITLLLLSLFTVLTLSMVIATSSDTLIDGYYRNARGSFYGADSGINAARQYLVNQVYSALPSGYVPSSGTPTLTSPATMLANLTNSSTGFGAYQSILGSQTASWPGTFLISSANSSFALAGCTPTPACSTPGTAIPSGTTALTYTYLYHLMSNGQSRSSEVNTVEEWGNIVYTVEINPTTSTATSFAAYGTLFDQYALCAGPFVPGTMSGKFFSNQSWNFGDASALGTSTKYIFTGPVGLAGSQVGYEYGEYSDYCVQAGAASANNGESATYKGITINPSFAALDFSQPVIPLPTNSYNQESAVLDGLGDCSPPPAACSAPSQAAMSVLTKANGTSYPSSGSPPATGVFMPYTITTVGGVTTKKLNSNAGGIYVQGAAAQVQLSTATVTIGGSQHTEQLIQITQGATTTTVTMDLTAGTTRMTDTSGNDTGIMTGIPQNLNTSPVTEGCMVYVNGNISSNTSSSTPTGLSGPSSGAAIASGSGITIVSTGTIDITGSLTYANEPVSLTTADTPVSPAPTNVLGIYTGGGNVELKPPTNVSTMEIDAALAEIASGASYGMVATWNSIGTLNIVGGRVQDQALSGNSLTSRNIYFDQRFSTGFAPPWFPTTTVTTTTTNTAVPQAPQLTRLSWVNTSATQ